MGVINVQYWEEENYLQNESLLGILSISGVRKAEVEARKKAFLENANNLMVLCWYLPWTQWILTISL